MHDLKGYVGRCMWLYGSLGRAPEFEDVQPKMPMWALRTFGYVSGSEQELQKKLATLTGTAPLKPSTLPLSPPRK